MKYILSSILMLTPIWAGDALHHSQRPNGLNERINSAFTTLERNSKSSWGLFNGSDTYHPLNLDEHKIIKSIIDEDTKDTFYFMEIGAGNFQWGYALSNFINNQISRTIKAHIISIRGEKNLDQEIIVNGKCTLYNFGAFSIENMETAFRERGMELTNKIDLIVSMWCFCHLADPLGTFIQTYNMLTPGTGFLLMNGFFIGLNQQPPYVCPDPNEKMQQLLLATQAPFLIFPCEACGSLDHFMLRKNNNSPLLLPWQYQEYWSHDRDESGIQNGSDCITFFSAPHLENIEATTYDMTLESLRGNKALYYWLYSRNLSAQFTWQPFLKSEIAEAQNEIIFQFHLALDAAYYEKDWKKLDPLMNHLEINDLLIKRALDLSAKKGNWEFYMKYFKREKMSAPDFRKSLVYASRFGPCEFVLQNLDDKDLDDVTKKEILARSKKAGKTEVSNYLASYE